MSVCIPKNTMPREGWITPTLPYRGEDMRAREAFRAVERNNQIIAEEAPRQFRRIFFATVTAHCGCGVYSFTEFDIQQCSGTYCSWTDNTLRDGESTEAGGYVHCVGGVEYVGALSWPVIMRETYDPVSRKSIYGFIADRIGAGGGSDNACTDHVPVGPKVYDLKGNVSGDNWIQTSSNPFYCYDYDAFGHNIQPACTVCTLTLTHGTPGSKVDCYDQNAVSCFSVCTGCYTFQFNNNVIYFDEKGHRQGRCVAACTIAIPIYTADGVWIQRDDTNRCYNHIGPSATVADTFSTAGDGTWISTAGSITIDSKGHVNCATDLTVSHTGPSTADANRKVTLGNADAWITISADPTITHDGKGHYTRSAAKTIDIGHGDPGSPTACQCLRVDAADKWLEMSAGLSIGFDAKGHYTGGDGAVDRTIKHKTADATAATTQASAGDNTWITVTGGFTADAAGHVNGKTDIAVSHIGPSVGIDNKNAGALTTAAGDVSPSAKLVFTAKNAEFDAKGHYNDSNTDTYCTCVQLNGDTWISLSSSNVGTPSVSFSHSGPGTCSSEINAFNNLGSTIDGDAGQNPTHIRACYTPAYFDSKGHKLESGGTQTYSEVEVHKKDRAKSITIVDVNYGVHSLLFDNTGHLSGYSGP